MKGEKGKDETQKTIKKGKCYYFNRISNYNKSNFNNYCKKQKSKTYVKKY